MQKLFQVYLKPIVVLVIVCQFSLCFSTEGGRVEEGWRLHNELRINFKHETKEKTLDFSDEHFAMAHVLKPCPTDRPPTQDTGGETGGKDSKYLCMVRFTPILVTNEGIECGPPVSLTQEVIERVAQPQVKGKIVYNELGFLSGYSQNSSEKSGPLEDRIALLPSQMELDYLALIPDKQRVGINNAFAIKLVQRLYMDPVRLKAVLDFRYPISAAPECFRSGNYVKLLGANQVTRNALQGWEQSKQVILGDIGELIGRGDADSLAKKVKLLTETANDKNKLNEKRNEHEKRFAEFHINEQMNGYKCAEQAALDFLNSPKVQEYFRGCFLDDSIKGIVINLHCSHTPCCSCATALAAETQNGGVFKKLFPTKKILLICSAQNWYERKNMISYRNTNFLFTPESLKDTESLSQDQKIEVFIQNVRQSQGAILTFDLHESGASRPTPYPVVLLAYDVNTKCYAVDQGGKRIENLARACLEAERGPSRGEAGAGKNLPTPSGDAN